MYDAIYYIDTYISMLLGAINEREIHIHIRMLVLNFNQISADFLLESKGSFTNYVEKNWSFLDHSLVSSCPCVNVLCEQPLKIVWLPR